MRMNSVLLVLISSANSGAALAETDADEWQFQLTPYIWLPTIDGTLNFELPPSGGSPSVSVGPTDWLDLLNFGALIGGSARKGRFSVFTDIVYLSMTKNGDGRVDSVTRPGGSSGIPVSAEITLATRTDLDGFVWTLAIGYTVKELETSSLDIFAGARLLSLSVWTEWDLNAAIMTPDGEELLR